MRNVLLSLFLFVSPFLYAADKPYIPTDLKIELDQVEISEVVRFVYIEAFKQKPYFLAPELLDDKRLISFRYSSDFSKFNPFFSEFLTQLGYEIKSQNNVDFVTKRKEKSIEPELKKDELAPVLDPDVEIFIYTPKYRQSNFLINTVRPLFKGQFTQQGGITPASSGSFSTVDSSSQQSGSALSNIRLNNGVVVFYGDKREVLALNKLLEKIDTKTPEVMVSAVVYEVGTDKQNQSAISIMASLLKNTLSLSIGTAFTADNFFKVTTSGGLFSIIQLLGTDSRFSVLSNPSLRAVSGKSATINIGEDVPVLGSLVVNQNQPPVQSVEYRTSGLIFDLLPTVYDEITSVHVVQELSSFTSTKTGVNNTPTLIKRRVETDIQSSDGELIVLGGLKASRDSKGRSSLPFPGSSLTLGNSSSNTTSEILLLLELKKI